MGLDGLFFVVGIVLAAIILIPAVLAGVFVIIVVANRAEPDPSGRRPAVVYAFATAFVTLFVTLFATTGIVSSLARLIGDDPMPSRYSSMDQMGIGVGGFEPFPSTSYSVGDAVARGAVLSAIIAIVAGLVYFFHVRAAARATEGTTTIDPVGRIRASFVSAVSFVAVVIVVVSTVVVVYDIFKLAAPDVFAPDVHGQRSLVVRELLPSLYLALAATGLLLMHLRHLPPPLRPRFAHRLPAGPLGPRVGRPDLTSGPPEVPSGGTATKAAQASAASAAEPATEPRPRARKTTTTRKSADSPRRRGGSSST